MVESLLFTTITILITWLLIIIILAGTGQLLLRISGFYHFNLNFFIISFWIGFAAFLMFGQIWNIFLPADWRLWVIFFWLAFLGFVISHKEIGDWLKRVVRKWKIATIFIFIILAFAVEIAFRASHGVPVHDTGSYHLPATLWFHSFPVVPGLSNLHSRLGFNSSLFVYAASLSEWIWDQRPHHILMGPLILMTYLVSFSGFKKIIFSFPNADFSDFFGASLVLPVYFLYHWRNYAISLSPNAVVFLLLLIIVWLVLKGLSNRADGKINIYFIITALFSALAITIKLTIVPFAFFLWLVMIYWIVKENRKQRISALKLVFWILTFSILLIIPWLVRSVILSGYPLYPFTTGGFNVDWKVPEIQAHLEASWTKSYSKGTFIAPMTGFGWVRSWLKHFFNVNKLFSGALLPLLIATISAIVSMLIIIFKGRKQFLFVNKRTALIFITIFIGIIIWFFTAPDIRFGIGYFWVLACMLIGIFFYWFWKQAKRRTRFLVVVLLSVFLLFALIMKTKNIFEKHDSSKFLTWTNKPNQSREDLLNDGLSELPGVKMRKSVTNSGLVVNVPLEGNQVWDAPLLSTPHPSPGLALRNPHNIAEGFKSVGEWRPYGYPILTYPWHNYVTRRLEEYYGGE